MTRPDFDRIAETISPEQLAQAIGARPSRQAGEFHCPGPSHENGDHNPSMSLGRKDGRTVGCCHGGCDISGSPVQVAAAVW